MTAGTNGTAAAPEPFRALFIHTHDVSRDLKPSADGELAHAIHQTLHFALDGHQDDWADHPSSNCNPAATVSSASATPRPRPGFFPTVDPERPYISYLWDAPTKTLSLPNPSTITNPVADPCSSDLRSAYEVTAKFFYLSKGPSDNPLPPEWVDDALSRLTKTTGLITFDTLVLSFPVLDLDQGRSRSPQPPSSCGSAEPTPAASAASPPAKSAQLTSDLRHVARVWQSVSGNPQLSSLGLSDISQSSLEQLFTTLDPPVSPETPDSIPSPSRRPRVITINVKTDPCGFDRQLSAFCQKQNMLLVAHNDRADPLPTTTMPRLLSEFDQQLPHPLPSPTATLKPIWALKYTTLIRDRGVLADKGYVLLFSSPCSSTVR